MRAAFVLGFFSPVDKALKDKHSPALKARSVIFLGKNTPRQAFDLKQFKSEFFSRIADGTDDPVLVVATEMRGLEWVTAQLEQIVQAGRERAGARPIDIRFFHDAQDPEPILDILGTFLPARRPEGQIEITEDALRRFCTGGKILCVRGQNQTQYREALNRADVPCGRFEDHFEEMPLEYGSNVGSVVKNASTQYVALLYAWGDLKYLQPTVKKHWSALFQGETPAAAVARFRQALENVQRQLDTEAAEKDKPKPNQAG